MYQDLIKEYEALRLEFTREIEQTMDSLDFTEYNAIHLATHSCAIEGNSFSLDETRMLREQGLSMMPQNKTLYEVFEILDHFEAYKYMSSSLHLPFDEVLLKEVNRLVTLRTLPSRIPGAVPGAYTDVDMAAGDTIFGNHKELISRIPQLMRATSEAIDKGEQHPMIISARFHGFYQYLHPFRDGNGRTGRLLSNWILLKCNHPLLVIDRGDREQYISALKAIRQEGTDEFLIRFFFETAIKRMSYMLSEKRQGNAPTDYKY